MPARANASAHADIGIDAGLSLELSRVSRAEAVAQTLERDMREQSLGPGERLGTKDELRLRFGVALGTINEAVRLLAARGLVIARPGPGGGVFVSDDATRMRRREAVLGADWSRATLRDCAELRAALEPVINRHAAAQRRPEDIRALQALADRMQHALDGDDAAAYATAEWAFHRRVAASCPNAPLKSTYLTLLDLLETGLGSDGAAERPDPAQVEAHRRLVAAIASGDEDELRQATSDGWMTIFP